MARHTKVIDVVSDKVNSRRRRSIVVAPDPQAPNRAEPAGLTWDSNLSAHLDRAGKSRMQEAQRCALAIKIGQVQGNYHLQKAVYRQTESASQPSSTVPGLTNGQVSQVQANLTTNPQAAVNTIAKALADKGQVTLSYIEGNTIGYVGDRSRMRPGRYGDTSLTPGTGLPRPCRVIIGPDAVESVSTLYSTIMHEYQHVLQYRTGRTGEEAATELEAYLWEVENLEKTGMWRRVRAMAELPGQLTHWWEELSTNDERERYRTRYEAARETIRRLNERRLEEQSRQQRGRG